MVEALIELRMYTEATLDFPDEDIEFLRAGDVVAKLGAIRETLAQVLARAATGALLREGLTVVLVGRPNVGKSSLLNALAREEAAIVTPVAGTTRDTVERRVEIAGIPLTIVDTAGLRDTADPVEAIGIERTWAAIERADLVLLLVDARAGADALDAEDQAILARLPSGDGAGRRAQQVRPRANRADVRAASNTESLRTGTYGFRRTWAVQGAPASTCWKRKSLLSSVRKPRPRTRSWLASGTYTRCGRRRRIWPRQPRSWRRHRRRSSSSPRNCAARSARCPRSPASSPPTISSASSSGDSALANSGCVARETSP